MIPLFIKRGIFGAAESLQGNALCRRFSQPSLTVLSYHSVITADRSAELDLYCTTVYVRKFERHIDYVARRFKPLSGANLIHHLVSGQPFPKGAVLITFDDGYRNNATLARDVLLEKGVPAVFHVTTGYIGGRSILWPDEILLRVLDWPDTSVPTPFGPVDLPAGHDARTRVARRISEQCKPIPVAAREAFLGLLRSKTAEIPTRFDRETHGFMDWDEVRSLARSGFYIGSHTVSHPILSTLTAPEVAVELRESRRQIESRMGQPCEILAYPNGTRNDYSNVVCEEAAKAGYRVAFSQEDRGAGSAPSHFAIPRLGAAGQLPLSMFYARISGLHSLLSRARSASA